MDLTFYVLFSLEQTEEFGDMGYGSTSKCVLYTDYLHNSYLLWFCGVMSVVSRL